MSTIHESLMAGVVPRRPAVVRSRRDSDTPWWVIYPDDTAERWLDHEDAVAAAHAWCDEHGAVL